MYSTADMLDNTLTFQDYPSYSNPRISFTNWLTGPRRAWEPMSLLLSLARAMEADLRIYVTRLFLVTGIIIWDCYICWTTS